MDVQYERDRDGYSLKPSALILADDSGQAEIAGELLVEAGMRVLARMGLGDAQDSGTCVADVVLVEASAQPPALVERALAQAVTLTAGAAGAVVIATVDETMIDCAVAILGDVPHELLCRPSRADTMVAFAAAQARSEYRVRDATREAESLRLQRLNAEVARIAETLARLTRTEELPSSMMREPDRGYRGPDDEQCDVTAAEIRATIRARRMRSQFFSADLFADPAWDMLLDLFAAQLERCRVSVSSLCIAAAVPPTTALRWIGALHEAGLFERQADPFDRRRAYIALSVKGLQGMQAFVSAVKRAGLPLV